MSFVTYLSYIHILFFCRLSFNIYIYIYMYVYFILEMHKTDCIDIELYDKCFSLSCECIIVNIDLRMISGEHRRTN